MLALQGMVILDLAPVLPGGLCTQILADLGAEVIKIENPGGGDGFRNTPPLLGENGSYFHILNRNKKSMTLNVKTPEGKDILCRLAAAADIIIENARPGTMDDLGIGYEAMKRLNPRLIYCSLTGFGQTGPYRDRPAHDINILAISGILDLLGEKGRAPIVPALMIAGAGGGLQAALGILSALLHREQSGAGRYLDVSLLDGLSPFLALLMSEYFARREAPVRGESRLGGGYACYNIYATKDGKYLAIGCLEDKFWQELCRGLGRDDLIGDLHAPPSRQAELINELREIFQQKDRTEWQTILERLQICFAPVNTLPEALADPQVQQRGLWFQVTHPTDGEVPQQAFPIKFADDRPVAPLPPPSLGEHTGEILTRLGYSAAEIAALQSRGVV